MSNKKYTVEAVIPAYNEEANIKYIIQSILDQKGDNFILEEITIISDGSTDDTVRLVQSIKDSRISLLDFKIRRGKYAVLNDFFHKVESDFLLHCDADVILKDGSLEYGIKELIKDKNVGLVCGDTEALPSETFMESIATAGEYVWRKAKDLIGDSSLMYRCIGRCYMLKKDLAREIILPETKEEDLFIFFFTLTKNFTVKFVPEMSVYFRLATNLSDYLKQMVRYRQTNAFNYFDKTLVSRYNNLSLVIKLKAYFYGLIKFPFRVLIYGIILFLAVLKSYFTRIPSMWYVSHSTKVLYKENE